MKEIFVWPTWVIKSSALPLAAIPSVWSEAMNNLYTCGQPDTHKNKELCNAEAHTEGKGQDGAVEFTAL